MFAIRCSNSCRVRVGSCRAAVGVVQLQQRPYQGTPALYFIGHGQTNKYGDNFSSRRGAPRRDTGENFYDEPAVEPKRLSFRFDTAPSAKIDEWRSTHDISVSEGSNCPNPILSFDEAPFTIAIPALKRQYPAPLPIQSQGWSMALSGTDMVGCADTGSGKTVAFLLPALEHIHLQGRRRGDPAAIVLCPTRELALQIAEEARKYSGSYGINVACVYGGQQNRREQLRELAAFPGLIIATPGRLLDFANAGNVNLTNVSFLVLDEADRMLDMGFERDLREVLQQIHQKHQVCMWSATWPKQVAALARDFFPKYIRVNVGSQELTANPNVKQEIEVIPPSSKNHRLLQIIAENQGAKILVFVETKASADYVGEILYNNEVDVALIHGDKSQAQRTAVISDFKRDRLKVVVATDVAARGLDVKDIDLVINYDFPQNIPSYIHRIGRTARAGKKGTAISFFTQTNFHQTADLIEVLGQADQPIPDSLKKVLKQEDEIKQAKQMAAARENKRKQNLSSRGPRSYGGYSGGSSYGDYDNNSSSGRSFGYQSHGGGGNKGRDANAKFDPKNYADFYSYFDSMAPKKDTMPTPKTLKRKTPETDFDW